MKDRGALLPKVLEALDKAEKELHEKGIPYVITSTWRSTTTQVSYYLQGRANLWIVNLIRGATKDGDDPLRPISVSENSYKITQCDGVSIKSPHQERRAVDMVPPDDKGNPSWPPVSDPRWKQISEVMVKYGFRWGGDWDGDGKTRYDGDLDETFVDFPHYEMEVK